MSNSSAYCVNSASRKNRSPVRQHRGDNTRARLTLRSTGVSPVSAYLAGQLADLSFSLLGVPRPFFMPINIRFTRTCVKHRVRGTCGDWTCRERRLPAARISTDSSRSGFAVSDIARSSINSALSPQLITPLMRSLDEFFFSTILFTTHRKCRSECPIFFLSIHATGIDSSRRFILIVSPVSVR